MKKINHILLLAITLLFLASCGKDGATGPQGPQGQQGVAGPTGANGKDGTVIYSGNTVPATSVGAIGDFYIDLTTGIFYGPKTSSGWGTGFSLNGPAGTNGKDGTVIYSGNTPPLTSIGAIGDFYIDLTAGIFYGPKTASGWGTGFSIVGPGGTLGINFPTILNTIITPAILDTLIQHGTVIHGGLTPPTLTGIYLLSPDYCLFDNSGDNYAGKLFEDYKYQFSSQDNTNFSIHVNYKNVTGTSTDVGSDVSATYISGSGDMFTIYAQATGVASGIPYTSLLVLSGEIVSGGIQNLQKTEYLVSKTGDSGNALLERVGSTRIFEDQDGLSGTQTTFSTNPNKIQSIGNDRDKSSILGLHTSTNLSSN